MKAQEDDEEVERSKWHLDLVQHPPSIYMIVQKLHHPWVFAAVNPQRLSMASLLKQYPVALLSALQRLVGRHHWMELAHAYVSDSPYS